ncbi:MAG: fatty acid desaturase [Caulobacterales bacterium]
MTFDIAQEAHRLTSDLQRARPKVVWTDFALTTVATYAGLAIAVLADGALLRLAGALLSIVALYRGVSFIHEITHLRASHVPGFKFAWNAVFGVVFLTPSLFYEGVHNLHHIKTRYGTIRDPEYLPLSHRGFIDIFVFVAIAALAPLGGFLRFGILGPLSFAIPAFRKTVIANFSSLTINPDFRREDLSFAKKPAWLAQEIAAWIWSWAMVAIVWSGGGGARAVLTGAVLMSVVAVVNQVRTLVAHAWTNEGEQMSVAEQLRDTLNVPPPDWTSLIWAPVGLRYHALHHLLPGIPYHNLGEAHRRLLASLPADSDYHYVQARGLAPALGALFGRVANARKTGPRSWRAL